MKKSPILNISLISFLFVILFSVPAFAQVEQEVEENIEIEEVVEIEVEDTIEEEEEVKKKRKIEITFGDSDDDDDDEEEYDHDDDDNHDPKVGIKLRTGMLDVGISSFLYEDSFELPEDLDELDLQYGLQNFNLHFLRYRIPIIKEYVSIENGLSVAWNQYRFTNNFEIARDTTQFATTPLEGDYKKNKLRTTAIEMPLMLTIQPGKKESVFISAGVYGGIILSSKQKLVTEDGDKSRFKDDFNLNKTYYGLEGRIGLGPVSFYAKYSLKGLFKEGRGPEVTPINIGITLINW